MQYDLTPIVCVGESQAEREAGETLEVIVRSWMQLQARLKVAELTRVIVAYEPIWAIGTGLTATPEQAQEVHAFIRKQLAQRDAAMAGGVTNFVRRQRKSG